MKSLKLGTLALLFLSIFIACTKNSEEVISASQLSTGRGGPDNLGSGDINPGLEVIFKPDPAVVNKPVQVIGTFDGSTAIPDCGKLQLFQKINGSWEKVAEANISASVHAAIYEFTPTIVGDDVYEFCVHFVKAGCDGFSTNQSTEYYLDVTDPCVAAFTITSSVSAVDMGNGLYEFSVSYTLTSPVDVTGVKFQGGATAGGNTGHQVTDLGNTVVVNANLNNTVLKWEGDLQACTAQVVNFKYTRNFNCPATNALVTGQWSASAGGSVLGSIPSLPYSCQ
jgi:hypothetical protein